MVMNMRIAIVDDQKEICQMLSDIVQTYYQGHVTIDRFSNGTSLLVSKAFYDLVFLDIEMHIDNGIEIGKRMREKNMETVIVIVSGFARYQSVAYSLHVFDFILKPFSKKDITSLLEEFDRYRLRRAEECLSFLTDDGYYKVPYSHIRYLESQNRYVYLHTLHHVYRHYDSLTQYSFLLNHRSFVQPHRSFIVNMQEISSFDEHFIVLGEDHIPIARGRRKLFMEAFESFLKGDDDHS